MRNKCVGWWLVARNERRYEARQLASLHLTRHIYLTGVVVSSAVHRVLIESRVEMVIRRSEIYRVIFLKEL